MSKPIIKFKTDGVFNPRIQAVEVERETQNSVWIKGRRNARRSSYENYFDSFEQAKAFLVAECERQVAQKKKGLHRARTALGNAQSLKERP